MVKKFRSLRKYLQSQYERMAFNKSPSSPRRFASNWLTIKRQSGTSHRVLTRPGWPDYVFAFHDREEIGPKMLARIAKHTGLTPKDL
jgi:predicted RNA binding protein YcfA (HicA-like mRNA interferase family)